MQNGERHYGALRLPMRARVLSAEHSAAQSVYGRSNRATGQRVRTNASLVFRELGGGLRMWVWVLGAMIVALFVGFAWVTK